MDTTDSDRHAFRPPNGKARLCTGGRRAVSTAEVEHDVGGVRERVSTLWRALCGIRAPRLCDPDFAFPRPGA